MPGLVARLVLAAVLTGPALAIAQPATVGPGFTTADWPRDGYELFTANRWAAVDAALERFRTAPLDPETVRALSLASRPNEAIATLQRIATERPDRLADALMALEIFPRGDNDEARAQKARGRELVETARRALPSMPREEQARLAAALLRIEGDVLPERPRYPELHRRFVAEYAGTKAAALVAIDVMVAGSRSAATLTALRELADRHPGDEIGAKALYTLAFEVAKNAGVYDRAAYQDDPTPRFLQVVDLVHRLESGAWPDGQWVRDAPRLIGEYSFHDRKLPAAQAQQVLGALSADARARAARWQEPAERARVESLLLGLLPRVVQSVDRGPAAADTIFEDVARAAPEPDAIRLLQVSYLLSRFYRRPTADDRAAATRILEALAGRGTADTRRKAMAALGDVALADGRPADARARFARFVEAHPSSDFAWMAAFRIGQIDRSLDKAGGAVEAFRDARRRAPRAPYAAVLVERALGEALEASDDPASALPHYRAAVAAWRPDWPGPINAPRLALPTDTAAPALVAEAAAGRAERGALVGRVEQLTRFLPLPGGPALERGRWLRDQGRASEAVAALAEVARARTGTPVGDEATRLLHGAQLDAALTLDAGPRSASALAALEALAREPVDEWVGLAGIAQATILRQQGNGDAADAAMRATLRRWIAGRPAAPAPAPSSLEADVVRLRDAVMQLRAGDVADRSWTFLEWPTRTPPFRIASAKLPVSEVGAAEARRIDVSRQPAGLDNVLFLSDDAIRYLARLVTILGGTERRQPAHVMEVPNQPAGDARAIITWWNGHFPTIPGHWGGVEVLTPPEITDIRFSDADRTRALVKVTVGYKGGTVVFERVDGVWRPTALIEAWIT